MHTAPPKGRPSFNVIAAENLRRGLYALQSQVQSAVARDPRTSKPHCHILGEVIAVVNNETTTRSLSEGVRPGAISRPAGIGGLFGWG